MENCNVKKAEGKLGVLVVGLGAVSTTFMTGVLMARKGLAKPVGSMTQYDKIRVGRGAEKKYLHYKDIVPLADLNDIVFGSWDVYPANAYESAINAEVLKEKDIEPVKDELVKIVPMKAAFDHNYAKRLDGDNVKTCANRWDMMEQVREDIRNFKAANNCSRIVVLWAASTEIYVPVDEKIHGSLASLEAAMKADDKEHIAPSMCYAYAALSEGAPFIMGAPNTTVDIPAMWELAEKPRCLSPVRTSRLVKLWLSLVSLLSSEPVASACQDGSLQTSSVTATVLCSTSLQTSTLRKSANCLLWSQSSCLRISRISTKTTTTKCASTTIHRATTTRKDGITSTSSDGWATQCRSKSTSSAATLSSLLLFALTSCCSATWLHAQDATALSAS